MVMVYTIFLMMMVMILMMMVVMILMMMVVMISIPFIQVAEDKVLAVTCLHLDHKLEPR